MYMKWEAEQPKASIKSIITQHYTC